MAIKPETGHGILLGFALLCVAVTSSFIMVMAWRINDILARPEWCARALGAGKSVAEGKAPIAGLNGCINLLTIQLRSLATNSHIFAGAFAMCLLVLIVIVVAGGRLSFKGSKDGIEGNIGRGEDPPQITTTTQTTTTAAPPPTTTGQPAQTAAPSVGQPAPAPVPQTMPETEWPVQPPRE